MNQQITLFLLSTLCAILPCASSAEIHIWTDENGKTHMSDTPPRDSKPSEIKTINAKDIEINTLSEGANAKQKRLKRLREIDQKKKRKEQAKAEQERQAKKLEKRCARLNKQLRRINDGWRLFYENEKNEKVYWTEEQRVQQKEQLEKKMKNCP